jgi:hypothetical protein
VTLRTWAFAIQVIRSSTPVAHALICPEAKYVAVRWQDGRLDRRHLPPALWPELAAELARDLRAGPISQSSMISTVLVGSMGGLLQVTFLEAQSLRVGLMKDAESALDTATRAFQAAAT